MEIDLVEIHDCLSGAMMDSSQSTSTVRRSRHGLGGPLEVDLNGGRAGVFDLDQRHHRLGITAHLRCCRIDQRDDARHVIRLDRAQQIFECEFYLLTICDDDPLYHEERTRTWAESLGPSHIDTMEG